MYINVILTHHVELIISGARDMCIPDGTERSDICSPGLSADEGFWRRSSPAARYSL